VIPDEFWDELSAYGSMSELGPSCMKESLADEEAVASSSTILNGSVVHVRCGRCRYYQEVDGFWPTDMWYLGLSTTR